MTRHTGAASLLAVLLLFSTVVLPGWSLAAAAPATALEHGAGHACRGRTSRVCGWDYGDAPAPYRTTRARNGPRHRITLAGALTIGTTVTADRDGQPTDGDLDDGLAKSVRVRADTPRLTVRVRNTTGRRALLVGWLDTSGVGFTSARRAMVDVPAGARQVILHWRLPPGTPTGVGQLRLRLYPGRPGHPIPVGAVHGGEVEDYRVTLVAAAPQPTPTVAPPPTPTLQPTLAPTLQPTLAPPPVSTAPRPRPARSTSQAAATTTRPVATGRSAPTPASPTTRTSPAPPPTAAQPVAPTPAPARAITYAEPSPSPPRLPLTWSIALLIVAPAAAGAAHAVGRAARRRH